MTIAITIGGKREQPPNGSEPPGTIGKWGSDSYQIGARVPILILGTETSGWIPQTHQQIAPRACSSERAAGGWGLRSTAARAPRGQLTTAPRAGGSADGEVRRGRVRTRAGAARRGSAEGGGWEQGMLGWPRRLKGARGCGGEAGQRAKLRCGGRRRGGREGREGER